MKLKRTLAAIILVLCLLFSLAACGQKEQGQTGTQSDMQVGTESQPASRTFTDSLGRAVTLPQHITRVSPSGAAATMFLIVVSPEYMVTIHNMPDADQLRYLSDKLPGLPETGTLYGAKSNINPETLLSADPQVIIDMGEPKDGMASELDDFQKKIGIPVVFIRADLEYMEEAFRTLGSILEGKEARCNELADYTAETLRMVAQNRAKQDEEAKEGQSESARKTILYATSPSGLSVHGKGSTNAQVPELLGADNAAVLDSVSNKGTGTPVSVEQILIWDPDVIFFTADVDTKALEDNPSFRELRAFRNKTWYCVPEMPYNWLSTPPSLNMLLGIRWAGNLLYPEEYNYDIVEETQRFFRLFWDYELLQEEAKTLLFR